MCAYQLLLQLLHRPLQLLRQPAGPQELQRSAAQHSWAALVIHSNRSKHGAIGGIR